MQEAWKEKVSCDTILPQYYSSKWDTLKEDYIAGTEISIFRQVDLNHNDNVQLHIFCDASSKAYGVVAYSVTDNHSELIMSKSREAPIKT